MTIMVIKIASPAFIMIYDIKLSEKGKKQASFTKINILVELSINGKML